MPRMTIILLTLAIFAGCKKQQPAPTAPPTSPKPTPQAALVR